MLPCFNTKKEPFLAQCIGKIAEKLIQQSADLKWSAFVTVIGNDLQAYLCRNEASIITADFVSITGHPITESTTGSVSPILNKSGVVNDGRSETIDFCEAVKSVQTTAQPLLIDNTAKYKGDFIEDNAGWIQSALMVPVLLQGVVYGVLRIYSSKKKAFDNMHVEYATIIGSIIQSYLSSNRTTKLLRMSMQNQGAARAKPKPVFDLDIVEESED